MDIDVEVLLAEARSVHPDSQLVPTHYNLILNQLNNAVNLREAELTGSKNGVEHSHISTLLLPLASQVSTDDAEPDDPVPDVFELADFLPEEDQSAVTHGETARAPDTDVLKFILIKRKKDDLQQAWTIPDESEFQTALNHITQHALSTDTLDAYAWSDGKRGNIALHTHSMSNIKAFREVVRQYSPPDPNYQYETYLRDNVVKRFSLTVLLKKNLEVISTANLCPMLFSRNKYLKGSLSTVRVKTYGHQDINHQGVSRAGWRLVHLVADQKFLDSIFPFRRTIFFISAPSV